MKQLLEKLSAPDNATEKFALYENLLTAWNEKFNLTAITDSEEIRVKHFADSLAAVKLLKQNAVVLDIGSGAGFPAVPLKIVRPDISVTMIDSVNKKVGFLNEVILRLGLTDTRALHIRAEDMDKNIKFDAVVSRAVARLNTLSEYALPFVKIGGLFIAYKSEKTDEEIEEAKNAIAVLGGKIKEVKDVSGGEFIRKLVVIEKVADTPPKYPRGKNLPRLKPL